MKKIWKYGLPIMLVSLVVTVVIFRIISNAKVNVARRQTTPLVKCERPIRESVKISLQFNGDVLPIRQAGIFSKVIGNLERIYSDMGSKVSSGQLLATIDSTELYQQFQQMNATYQNARMTFVRVQQLIEKNLASKQDLDNAEAAMKVAKANYEAAATRLSYARIIAPFSGIITKRFLDPGALVTANNATLFTLMDLDRVKIIVNVSEKDVQYVYKVRTANVTLDALRGKEFEAIVTRMSDALDLTTRTMAVQIEISNFSHTIKPGMFATVQMIVAEHPNAITVPTNSILKDDAGRYVFILDEQKAKRVAVITGAELLERTEILSGLAGDETVIIVGQQFVKDGGHVNYQR